MKKIFFILCFSLFISSTIFSQSFSAGIGQTNFFDDFRLTTFNIGYGFITDKNILTEFCINIPVSVTLEKNIENRNYNGIGITNGVGYSFNIPFYNKSQSLNIRPKLIYSYVFDYKDEYEFFNLFRLGIASDFILIQKFKSNSIGFAFTPSYCFFNLLSRNIKKSFEYYELKDDSYIKKSKTTSINSVKTFYDNISFEFSFFIVLG